MQNAYTCITELSANVIIIKSPNGDLIKFCLSYITEIWFPWSLGCSKGKPIIGVEVRERAINVSIPRQPPELERVLSLGNSTAWRLFDVYFEHFVLEDSKSYRDSFYFSLTYVNISFLLVHVSDGWMTSGYRRDWWERFFRVSAIKNITNYLSRLSFKELKCVIVQRVSEVPLC